jgi:hypothetical protein
MFARVAHAAAWQACRPLAQPGFIVIVDRVFWNDVSERKDQRRAECEDGISWLSSSSTRPCVISMPSGEKLVTEYLYRRDRAQSDACAHSLQKHEIWLLDPSYELVTDEGNRVSRETSRLNVRRPTMPMPSRCLVHYIDKKHAVWHMQPPRVQIVPQPMTNYTRPQDMLLASTQIEPLVQAPGTSVIPRHSSLAGALVCAPQGAPATSRASPSFTHNEHAQPLLATPTPGSTALAPRMARTVRMRDTSLQPRAAAFAPATPSLLGFGGGPARPVPIINSHAAGLATVSAGRRGALPGGARDRDYRRDSHTTPTPPRSPMRVGQYTHAQAAGVQQLGPFLDSDMDILGALFGFEGS